MLRADMSPKPVYEQVNQLIHQEWKTRLDATTDSDGRWLFAVFAAITDWPWNGRAIG